MLLAVLVSLASHFGSFGGLAAAFSPFVALGVAFTTAPLIALATRSRYYLARKPRAGWAALRTVRCVVCENSFDPEDSAYCPVYQGAICSLCCSLDARCGDLCKPQAGYSVQLHGAASAAVLPPFVRGGCAGRIGRYCAGLAMLGAFTLRPPPLLAHLRWRRSTAAPRPALRMEAASLVPTRSWMPTS